MSAYEPFAEATKNHKTHMTEFLRQLIQHNVRVIEKYYARIKLHRLAHLVGVSHQQAESEICDMVVNGRLNAKINRLEGIVTFNQKKQFTNDKLGGWNNDIRVTLDKIEHTCHLINREAVIHQK